MCGGANSERNSVFDLRGAPDHPSAVGLEEADCICVDEYLRQKGLATVDLLKLDCEGSEIKALQGATRAIGEGRIQAVQFEYNHTWLPGRFQLRDAFCILAPAGFDIYRIAPRRLERKLEYSFSDEDYRLANYLAVRDDLRQVILRGAKII